MQSRKPEEASPLDDARDALFGAIRKAAALADAVEVLEARYAKIKRVNPEYFVVRPMDSGLGRKLPPDWTDHAPREERGDRRRAIDATLALRAAVDNAAEAVAQVGPYMDGEAQGADQRWTVKTIGQLRKLRGAILRGHERDHFPSALS
jgi:hypothetical protein